MFSQTDYQTLHSIVFALDADGRPRYPGYRPELVEYPSKDGTPDERDRTKKFAHVAWKYQEAAARESIISWREFKSLDRYIEHAHAEALRVADALGVQAAFRPDIRYSALRVLEYPPGSGTQLHTDFNLFTLLCYRDRPEGLVRYAQYHPGRPSLDGIAPGLHIGELGEIVGLGPATPHEVIALPRASMLKAHAFESQHSIVYFAIPDHAAVLPPVVRSEFGEDLMPMTVGQWLNERMARSRSAR